MNWLQKIAQKPMALPKVPPTWSNWQDDTYGGGAMRIDDVMSPQTAEEQFEPDMQYAGHGSFGVVYRTGPGEVSKFSKDPREAETAQLVFDQKYDWIVPMLAPPEQVQYDPPVYRLRMKEMKPLEQHETMLVNYLEMHYEKKGIPSIEFVMENFVPYVDVDKVMYIYKRMKYILEQNEATLWLTDLHGGNFGWDGNELKVWDIGPDTSKR